MKDRLRVEAEALDALRKRVLAEHDDLTLTKLYNVLGALKENRALTDGEMEKQRVKIQKGVKALVGGELRA